jgi:uncharacterized protein YhjY with autotransporter beta-barrel domain
MNVLHRTIRFRIAIYSALLACGTSGPLTAQTLDEQYAFYLAEACAEMNFEKDNVDAFLIPGQAGPNLTAQCNGPPPVGGGGTDSNGAGGNARAAGVGLDDQALRRRRDAARSKQADTDSIASYGNLGVFLSLDYLHQQQDATRYEGARRSILRAGTLGADYRFSQGIVGLAGRYEDHTGAFGTGGDFETRGRGISLYGSWIASENAFVDLTVSANFRSDETHRIVALQRTIFFFPSGSLTFFDPEPAFANSEKDSTEYSAQLSAGYDFFLSGFTVGPRMGLATLRNTQDAYVETGNTPMTLAFDEQEEKSTRSSAGIQASFVFTPTFGVLTAQLNADWQHEFEDDQRLLTARFAEDFRPNASRLRFLDEAPDRDVYVVRASMIATLPHGVGAFIAAHKLFDHDYQSRYGGSIGVRKAF